MKAFAIAAAATLISCGEADSAPQPDPSWITDVQSRAHTLASIDIETADDADLAFLEENLGGRRIVELGENTHGAAQYSQAKTRLIRYLHEQLGYDVLVWESSILGTYLVDQDLDARTTQEATTDALVAPWHTDDVVELFAYLKSTRATARPLRLAGMDLGFSSTFEEEHRPELFRELVANIDATYADEVLALDREVATKLKGVWRTVFQSEEVAAWEVNNAARLASAYRKLAAFLEQHEKELVTASPVQPALPVIACQTALGAATWFESLLPGAVFRDLHDAFMADSFQLIADSVFPEGKMMIWAHDSHLFKAGTRSSGGSHTGYRDAGQIIAERYGKDVYMVSLLMNHGRAADGLRKVYSVSPGAAWSIEGLMRAHGASVAFLDLASATPAPERAWMDQEFVFRDFGLEDVHAVPREQMDGVLFFESVDPPTYFDP
jgi:erythromycin esterase